MNSGNAKFSESSRRHAGILMTLKWRQRRVWGLG